MRGNRWSTAGVAELWFVGYMGLGAVFVKFYWNTVTQSCLDNAMAALELRLQTSTVVTLAVWPAEP